MVKNDVFDFKRLFDYMKIDFFTKNRLWLIGGAAFGGFALIISGITAFFGFSGNIHLGFYPVILYLGGFYISSMAYSEIHMGETSYSYLTLPASTLEKTIGKVLIYGVGYVVLATGFYVGVSILSEMINKIIFTTTHPVFNPFRWEMMYMIGFYLAFHTIYLMGSAWFKKHAFIKTFLIIIVISLAITLVSLLAFKIVFYEYFDGWQIKSGPQQILNHLDTSAAITDMAGLKSRMITLHNVFNAVWKIYFWGVVPLGGLLGIYFKLKEAEV